MSITRPLSVFALLAFVSLAAAGAGFAAETLHILSLDPTPLFPRTSPGEPVRQLARLRLQNDGAAVQARMTVTIAGQPPHVEELGQIEPKESLKAVQLPDVKQPTEISLTLHVQGREQPVDSRTFAWQPQKKWTLYCVAYSHHDLGFGDYPHRLRTTIRHANITRPLQFCRDTDGWDEDSKFRFVIETSEPITSFLCTQPIEVAEELGRRIREGRIQLGGFHNTANTEQLGHELLARLFYLSNRHARDLLGIPKSRTAMIDDVIGLTWPLAGFCAEADVPYLFHGPNGCGRCFGQAADEPIFKWEGPTPGKHVTVRSSAYGGYAGDAPGDLSEARVQEAIARLGAKWPYDALLLQEGTDFQLVTMDTATRIHAWNARFAYPRLVCGTMDMFLDTISAQAKPEQVKSFAGDGNNQWADQDGNDAWALGKARRLAEDIPTAEKFATVAQIVAGGGNSWTDIYQAYHRLLAWHEHTNAIDVVAPDLQRMRRYETELAENREMLLESADFANRARSSALERITAKITRETDRSLVVFNPLARQRTDIARVDRGLLAAGDRIVDPSNNREIPWQAMPDGSAVFVATEVPSLGYKTFAVHTGEAPSAAPDTRQGTALESRFFRVAFDPASGAITSIRDKQRNAELVDSSAAFRFNEYLYQRFESADSKQPIKWQRVQSATVTLSSGKVAQSMQIKSHPVGVESLTQTVVLYDGLPRIDFAIDLVKSPSGRRDSTSNGDARGKESMFVALPLAIPNPQVRHELPGCVSEPVKDLFDGANTAHYAIRHFSDIAGDRYGVTVSATDSSLVEYDRPRPDLILGGQESAFEKAKKPITTGHVYLYLMNNMFDVNVRWDQAGPAHFEYSLQPHDGNWQNGRADEFGWDAMNPLLAVDVRGAQRGELPATNSFVTIDQPNVACTTFKPAEFNGSGFILRFIETRGIQTEACVSLPLLAPLSSANVTSLVEDDRQEPLKISDGNRVTIKFAPFGVRTIRVARQATAPAAVADLAAQTLSDMEVALAWKAPPAGDPLSHYHVYRSTKADFEPNALNLVQRVSETSCTDRPQLHFGGWINNRLEPKTTYYYRVAAVDRSNREGPLSPAVSATTKEPREKNLLPLQVQCLRAVPVSPLSRFNAVNLLWRTNCESDVRSYEVHRSTAGGFEPNEKTRIAVVDAQSVLKGGTGYGQTVIEYRLGEFDHQMYLDEAVEPSTTYYYRVCAVDTAGQKGAPSVEVRAATKAADPLAILGKGITAQSVYAPEYGVELAIDGSTDPYFAWISKPYGGGTKQNPNDVWWAFEFPKGRRLAISGVKIIGDHREVIPLQKNLQVQARVDGQWKTVGQAIDAKQKDIVVQWQQPIETDAIRIYVPAADLPETPPLDTTGIVRICELQFLLGDGRTVAPVDVLVP